MHSIECCLLFSITTLFSFIPGINNQFGKMSFSMSLLFAIFFLSLRIVWKKPGNREVSKKTRISLIRVFTMISFSAVILSSSTDLVLSGFG